MTGEHTLIAMHGINPNHVFPFALFNLNYRMKNHHKMGMTVLDDKTNMVLCWKLSSTDSTLQCGGSQNKV